jgi:VanZ family protein
MTDLGQATRGPSPRAAVGINLALVLGYFWFGLRPAPALLNGADHRDKLWHFLGFGLLAVSHLLLTRHWFPRRAAWAAAACSLGWGMLLELAQGMVPSRSADVLDALADAGGAITVALIAQLVQFRRRRVS